MIGSWAAGYFGEKQTIMWKLVACFSTSLIPCDAPIDLCSSSFFSSNPCLSLHFIIHLYLIELLIVIDKIKKQKKRYESNLSSEREQILLEEDLFLPLSEFNVAWETIALKITHVTYSFGDINAA